MEMKAQISEKGDIICPKCNINIITPMNREVVAGIGQCGACKSNFTITPEAAAIANGRANEKIVAGIIHINEGINLDVLDQEQNKSIDIDDFLTLLGGWVKVENNYHPDPKHEYSAIYYKEDGYIAVVRSTNTRMCNQTSPCYTMPDKSRCGNLAEPNNHGVKAYDLPSEWYEKEDTACVG